MKLPFVILIVPLFVKLVVVNVPPETSIVPDDELVTDRSFNPPVILIVDVFSIVTSVTPPFINNCPELLILVSVNDELLSTLIVPTLFTLTIKPLIEAVLTL